MATTDYLAGALDQALRAAGVPLIGVSIGDPANRASWKPVLDAKLATDEDAKNAAAVIEAFDVSTIPAKLIEAQALVTVGAPEFAAAIAALYQCIPNPTMTLDALQALILSNYTTAITNKVP